MQRKLVFCLFIGVLATLLLDIAVNAIDRRDRHGSVDAAYDVRAERVLEGIVAGKGHVMDGLMYFPLKTADTIVEVQVGPKEFVERSTFIFKPGDTVVVVGVPVVLNQHAVVLARQISGMNGTLILRDDDGVLSLMPTRCERIR
jgi:hypothetical protein